MMILNKNNQGVFLELLKMHAHLPHHQLGMHFEESQDFVEVARGGSY